MKRVHLGIDFGASRLKWALLDPSARALLRAGDRPALPNQASTVGRFEVDPEALRQVFREILALAAADAYELGAEIASVWIASEMHGFLLTDAAGRACSPYISWRDARSSEGSDSPYASSLRRWGDRVREWTGVRPFPGLPLMNLQSFRASPGEPKEVHVQTIPDWLAGSLGPSTGLAHDTMLGGLGVFDPLRRQTVPELVNHLQAATGHKFLFNEACLDNSVAGFWPLAGRRVPIRVGVGDHSCAVRGALAGAKADAVSLNLGTGSQVSRVRAAREIARPESTLEFRAYGESHRLQTITRIPSGRALEMFLAPWGSRAGWAALSQVPLAAILAASPDFSLAVFPGAWSVDGVERTAPLSLAESGLSREDYFATLLRSYVQQYVSAAQVVERNASSHAEFVLSGGIPRRLPVFAEALARLTARPVRVASTEGEETLYGLLELALEEESR